MLGIEWEVQLYDTLRHSMCASRSGQLRGADGAVRDVAAEVPRCVWYHTPAVRHSRHIFLQRLWHA